MIAPRSIPAGFQVPYTLVLGNQAYSSWSLRGWLLLRAFGIEFDLEVVPLRTGAFELFVAERHPARTVPTLIVGDGVGSQTIWDSLAIAEYLHERHPRAGREYRNFTPPADAQADIDRVLALWKWARENWGDDGPYLFGDRFCAADAFYAPVASRFRTYGVALDDASRRYVGALLDHPATVEFVAAGKAEAWVMPENEFDDLD